MKIQPLTIKNARIWDGKDAVERDLYTSDIVLDKPHPNAITVDLSVYTIFPGLINAHDHLELNHFPRTKFRDRYDNAHQWGEDINARLNESPFKELRAYPLEDRLFIGGLKNLLCGVTTVAHHNPPHKPLFRKEFPVRVVRKYGWAHSLHFNSDEEIVRSYRSTPPDVPWFIHLAEGTDEVATGEYKRLKALGCVGKNTVIVHGVGLTDEDIADAAPRVRGLVWCPSSNKYILTEASQRAASLWLFDKRLKTGRLVNRWRTLGNIAIGSDSRLSADGDLLDELRNAAVSQMGVGTRHHDHFIWMVTTISAEILGLERTGKLSPRATSDWIAINTQASDEDTFSARKIMGRNDLTIDEIEDFESSEHPLSALLCYSHRADLALVVRGGIPQIGDPDVMAKFSHIETVEATLDGVPKLINVQLARQIAKCSLKEPGLELLGKPKPRMFTFK